MPKAETISGVLSFFSYLVQFYKKIILYFPAIFSLPASVAAGFEHLNL